MRKWMIGAGALVAAAAGLAAALWLAPPLRLFAPSLFGMHCAERLCVERPEDMPEARRLADEASATLRAQTGLALPPLHIVMCRTQDCYGRFGGGAERAISYPFLGMLIAGQSWQDYIIRHEFIHWLQFEHFGAIETMRHPVWFREGMAYALSGAPDWDIPGAFRPWVAQYLAWQGGRPLAAVLSQKPAFE